MSIDAPVLDPATDQQLRVTRIASRPDQAASLADWNLLAGEVPFRQFEWLETWWRHYQAANAQLLTLTVRNADGDLLGLAPWYLTASPWSGRVVRFMGSGEVCSDYLTLLAREPDREAVARAVAEWLTTEAAGSWDLIHLDGVAPDDVAIDTLIAELAAAGHEVQVKQDVSAWRIALPSTWAEYVAQLSRTRRERVKQLGRRLFETGRAVSRFAASEAELDQGWQILIDLHQRRRVSLGEQGCFASARYAAFHAEASRRMFALGQLRLHWIELDGQPVAVEYGLTGVNTAGGDTTGGNTVYYYQTGLDPAVIDERPGWLNLIGSIRAAIEGGCQSFDFLRGDEPYKSSWRGQPRPLREIRIVGRHASARLRHRAWLQGSAAKQRLTAAMSRLRARLPGAKNKDNRSDNT